MSEPSRGGEDIAGLFAAFGGNVDLYQEFDNAPAVEQSPNWALLQRLGTDPKAPSIPERATVAPADAAPAAAHATRVADAALAPARAAVPAAAPLADAAALASTPAPLTAAPAATPTQAPAGTPLAVLFERLASAPEPCAPVRNSLMAHWRQSG